MDDLINGEVKTENEGLNHEDQKQAKKSKILDLLKERREIQKTNRKLAREIFMAKGKRGINGISNKVAEMKNSFMEQAKMYGKKAENMAKNMVETYANNKEGNKNVLQKYEESLEAIQKEYENRVEYILTNKMKMEELQEESELKEMDLREEREEIWKSPEYFEHVREEERCIYEIKQILEQEDVDIYTVQAKKQEYEDLKKQNPLTKCDKQIEEEKKKREEIQYVIGECDRVLSLCEQDNEKSIDEATKNKNNQIANNKQNIFQKTMGALFCKVNGAKKFASQVIGQLEEKVYDINNKSLPAIREKISDGIDKSIEKIEEKMTPLLDKGKNIGRASVEKVRSIADRTVQMTEDKLKQSIEKANQVNTQRSMAYAELTKQPEGPEDTDEQR